MQTISPALAATPAELKLYTQLQLFPGNPALNPALCFVGAD
ncbi:hypothetical protein ACGF12_28635 [Kitasatospora sp. NPDC048296]